MASGDFSSERFGPDFVASEHEIPSEVRLAEIDDGGSGGFLLLRREDNEVMEALQGLLMFMSSRSEIRLCFLLRPGIEVTYIYHKYLNKMKNNNGIK